MDTVACVNIEQVVSRLLMEGRLAGFHFNDSKYADDDLTAGCIKPYQLFLIFVELVEFLEGDEIDNPPLAWMIDASHNYKDPLVDLMQSLDAIGLSRRDTGVAIRVRCTRRRRENGDRTTATTDSRSSGPPRPLRSRRHDATDGRRWSGAPAAARPWAAGRNGDGIARRATNAARRPNGRWQSGRDRGR